MSTSITKNLLYNTQDKLNDEKTKPRLVFGGNSTNEEFQQQTFLQEHRIINNPYNKKKQDVCLSICLSVCVSVPKDLADR